MTRAHVTLTERQIEKIEREKQDTGLGKSEIVRRAVDRYFEEKDGNDKA
jgi:hypothetical protein